MTTLQSSLRTMNSSGKLVTTLMLCCLIGASEGFRQRFHHGSRLKAVFSCTQEYLNNSGYDHCRAYIRNATTAVNAKGTPMVIYCTYVECIRQVTKDTLIALSNVDLESENTSNEATAAAKKKRCALIMSQYLDTSKGICETQPARGNRHNYLRSRELQHWGHRRNFRQNPFMSRRGPRNVFQFFIDSNEPRQAYRRPYRMYRGENQMRRREFNYRRWESRNGQSY